MIPRGKIKDKRSAILNAALQVIANNGFHASSVKQIAEEASVATGTIYVYFENKEELIISLFVSIRKEISDFLVGGFDESKEFKENYIKLWKEVFDYYLENPLKFMFLEQYYSSPFLAQMESFEGSTVLNPAVELFEYGRKKGELKDLPALALLGLTNGSIISAVRMHLMKELDLQEGMILDDFILASYDSISK